MNLRKLSGWFLVLTFVALFTPKASAYVMVTVQATVTSASGTNAGMFTVSRSGTLSAVTVQLAISGTAVAGTDYVTIPTNITLAANVVSSNLLVKLTTNTLSTAKTVVLSLLTNSAYFSGLYTNGVVTLLPLSSTTNSVASPAGRYWRGSGSDPTYWSQVIPLDYETGTVYSNIDGNAASLYGIQAWYGIHLYHYNATNSLTQNNITNRIAFDNPIVAFGESVGGTPLYFNQPYSFGVYAGTPTTPTPDPPIVISGIRIDVYYRTNFGYAGAIFINPPVFTNTLSWNNFVTNGFQVTSSTNYLYTNNTFQLTANNFGLTTVLSDSPTMSWGASGANGGTGYVLTHTANNQAANYY
jgi:hypothetical protein